MSDQKYLLQLNKKELKKLYNSVSKFMVITAIKTKEFQSNPLFPFQQALKNDLKKGDGWTNYLVTSDLKQTLLEILDLDKSLIKDEFSIFKSSKRKKMKEIEDLYEKIVNISLYKQ